MSCLPFVTFAAMDVYQRRRLVALSALIAAFVIIVLLVRGCGGDDEQPLTPVTTVGEATTGVAATIPKQDYIDEADAICTESNAALAALDATDEQTAAQDETEIVAGQLDQLQTLPQPEEDADTAERFLQAVQDQVDALEERELAVERDDAEALTEIDATLGTAEADAQAGAEEFGFEVCGSPSETGADTAPTDTAPVVPAPTETVPAVPVAPEEGGAGTGGGATPDTGGGTGGTGSGSGGVSP